MQEFQIQVENSARFVPKKFHEKLNHVLNAFREMMDGKKPFHIVLDDPLGNSRVGFVNDDDEKLFDCMCYKRTWLQEKEFGIVQPKQKVFTGKEGLSMLVELIKKSKRICGLTGAGVSTGILIV